MIDREKVLKGLECCSLMNGHACSKCPYSFECVAFETEYQTGTAHLAADALSLLKEQPTVGGWINVRDRLPEHGKKYLIYATSGDNKVGYITTATFGGHFVLTGRRAYWKVTHWMPLPEPPEEVKQE